MRLHRLALLHMLRERVLVTLRHMLRERVLVALMLVALSLHNAEVWHRHRTRLGVAVQGRRVPAGGVKRCRVRSEAFRCGLLTSFVNHGGHVGSYILHVLQLQRA